MAEKKERRPFVMTEARKIAFERCQKARDDKVARLQNGRKLQKIKEKEEALKKKKEEILATEPLEDQEEEELQSDSDSSVELVVQCKPKSRHKPQIAVIEDLPPPPPPPPPPKKSALQKATIKHKEPPVYQYPYPPQNHFFL